MPQMSNLWWLPLMILFIIIFTMTMNHTMMSSKPEKDNYKNTKNMKWMW